MSHTIDQPLCTPGSGWHQIEGFSIPGSENDLIRRRERAFPCFVYPMRRDGVRIPAGQVMAASPVQGGLLMMQAGAGWAAHLFGMPEMRYELLTLVSARLIREADGCRTYQGLQRHPDGGQAAQTWLCTPTVDRGLQILREMVKREAGCTR